MTPPATPPPLPFAELMKKAKEADKPGSRLAQCEIDRRLAAWAHAGGVEELRMANELTKVVASLFPDTKPQAEKLRASLALLDGQRETP